MFKKVFLLLLISLILAEPMCISAFAAGIKTPEAVTQEQSETLNDLVDTTMKRYKITFVTVAILFLLGLAMFFYDAKLWWVPVCEFVLLCVLLIIGFPPQ